MQSKFYKSILVSLAAAFSLTFCSCGPGGAAQTESPQKTQQAAAEQAAQSAERIQPEETAAEQGAEPAVQQSSSSQSTAIDQSKAEEIAVNTLGSGSVLSSCYDASDGEYEVYVETGDSTVQVTVSDNGSVTDIDQDASVPGMPADTYAYEDDDDDYDDDYDDDWDNRNDYDDHNSHNNHNSGHNSHWDD